jgi:hypothetical protein
MNKKTALPIAMFSLLALVFNLKCLDSILENFNNKPIVINGTLDTSPSENINEGIVSMISNYTQETLYFLGKNVTMVKLEDDGHWIFNRNVLHHGTIMSLRTDKVVEIEVMLRFALGDYANKRTLKCLIKINEELFILRNVHQMKQFDSLHVFCLITEEEYAEVTDNRVVTVGVFDTRDYNASESNIIFGKIPEFFDRNVPKEKAFMVCACASEYISDTFFEQIIMWAKINRLIGSKKRQVYTTDIHSLNFKRLKENYSELVEMHGYNQETRALCVKHNFTEVQRCFNKYRGFFEYRMFGMNWPHQTIRMNDCFLKAKYKYQFVSNLDLDEIVFPRRFSIKQYSVDVTSQLDAPYGDCLRIFEAYISTLDDQNSFYNYMMKLEKIYGSSVASFKF